MQERRQVGLALEPWEIWKGVKTMNTQRNFATSRLASLGLACLNCVLVAGLTRLLIPAKLLPSEYAETRAVLVCILLGALLAGNGWMQTRFAVLQSVLPASTLLILYGRKLSQRGAIADMWPLSLIYPVIPVLSAAVIMCPWLARNFSRKMHR